MLMAIVGACAIGAALWFLWLGRIPTWPSGERIKVKYRGTTVHMVVHAPSTFLPAGQYQATAEACARAVQMTRIAWLAAQLPHHAVSTICVWFPTDERFDQWPGIKPTDAAFLAGTGANVGSGIPMVVIRPKYAANIIVKGEPVIHEVTHALLGDYSEPDKDRDHSHSQAWVANSGDTSLQAMAQRYFEHTMGQK